MPPLIAAVISADKATLHELDTIYGLEDLHDLLEIVAVDAANQQAMIEAEKTKAP